MFEKIGLWIVAALFVYTTGSALWEAEFRYHFGPLIRRRERPVEYWLVALLFCAVTVIVVAVALLRTFEFLPAAGQG